MNGANPQLDQNLLRVLYTLSELTNEARYREAADQELTWFFEHAMSPKTNLLPWGEHLSWDVMLDAPVSGGDEMMHEFARPWVLWERCFALAPEAQVKSMVHWLLGDLSGATSAGPPFVVLAVVLAAALALARDLNAMAGETVRVIDRDPPPERDQAREEEHSTERYETG